MRWSMNKEDDMAVCSKGRPWDIVHGSSHGPRRPDGTRAPISHREWCDAELARLRGKGDMTARLAERNGYVWITRAPWRKIHRAMAER